MKKTPAKKKKLGRTPKDTQAYIDESNAQIKKWTKELDQFYKRGQGNDIQKRRDMLRNKISALRSRMKRKQEQWESTEKIGGFTSQFSSFMSILEEELVGPEGTKIAKKI